MNLAGSEGQSGFNTRNNSAQSIFLHSDLVIQPKHMLQVIFKDKYSRPVI